MRRLPRIFCITLAVFALVLGATQTTPGTVLVSADEQSDHLQELNKQVQEYEQKLKELAGQKQTLAATVSVLNTKIALAQSQISKTEQELIILSREIDALNGRIGQLNVSLDQLSNILVRRIRETYRQSITQPLYLFFLSNGFTDFVNRYKYIRTVQNHDKELLVAMERTRANYNLQKTIKEEKQEEIETLSTQLKRQKVALASQQQEKQQLLELTKNDERRFQELLSKTRAELAAIQNIIAGKGEETKMGEINEGNKIASVIPTSSACSSGAHVHFEVVTNGAHQNPQSYLKPTNLSYDYDTSTVTETVSPGGNWRWPLDDPIVITQIYGATFWTKYLHYDFHTGIDMKKRDDSAAAVFAVSKGTLYRGSVSCGGGTLRYVKIDHGDSLSTYYLHVNYI